MLILEERRPATLGDVSWLRRALGRELASLRIVPDIANDALLAVAELLTNCVIHGSPAPVTVGLRVEIVGASLRIEVTDDGGAFSQFDARWAAAGGTELAATRIGGLGLSLVRATLRNVRYEPGPPNRLIGWRPLRRQRPAVLIVEDDPTLLKLYAAVLKERCRVFSTDSIEQALTIASTSTIDLILCDYHIGDGIGTGLLAALERDADRLPMPVVMISGDRQQSVRASAYEFGVELFLQKPVSPNALRDAVEQALTRASRRLASLFRYFAANAGQLLDPPAPEAMTRLGAALRQYAATSGGGDYLLHLAMPGRDRLVLADVMGHGLQAKAGAIAHAAVMRAVNDTANPADGPGRFLEMLSGVMRRDPVLAQSIVTAAVVDRREDGALEIASAGHPTPVVVAASGARALDVGGPLLGLVDAAEYRAQRLTLSRDEILVLVTDGVEPQLLAGGGCLPDGLVATIAANGSAGLSVAADAAERWARATHGPSPPDDWSILLLAAART